MACDCSEISYLDGIGLQATIIMSFWRAGWGDALINSIAVSLKTDILILVFR